MDKKEKLKSLLNLLNTTWRVPRYLVNINLGINVKELDELLQYAESNGEEIMLYYGDGAIVYLSLVSKYQKHYQIGQKYLL